ncbi:MAG TPA: putative nucleotidyltransferase substrate binding domain-containing protein [Streptosporangiaceae bacterium]|nr:putative nucleotidyltransferase substrate binding domain-containing protein [Streptosporangiaceae bacterium]
MCYRIPADIIRPLLARPQILRAVADSMSPRTGTEPTQRVGALIRTPPLLCRGDEPIREAARRMTDRGVSAVAVRGPSSFGIMTDRDLRRRVIGAGLSPDAPVSAVMTAPAYTVTGERLASDVLLDMLERNIHHIPVLSAAGEILGVVDDGDLVAAAGRTPLLRRAIALAGSQAELAAAAAGLSPMIIALHDARATPEHLTAVRSVVMDALIRRLAELAGQDAGPPPAPFTWFALGSLARREAVPSSDVDSALAWDGEDPSAAGYARGVARAVDEGLRAAQAAGTMESGEASALAEAFGLVSRLRLDHQVEQLRRGQPPDDFIDPKALNPLARSYLREAFRAVASVQANLSAELSLGVRWG